MKIAAIVILLALPAFALVALPLQARSGYATWMVAQQSSGQSISSNFLTGTYREKASQDYEIGKRALAVTAHLDSEEQRKQGRALLRILHGPPLFSFEQYGSTVTMNFPDGTRVPYEADDKTRVFRATGGDSVTVRAKLSGQTLTIDLTWSGGERLDVTYESRDDGKTLIYKRTATNRSLSGPVSISSEYERVSAKATRNFARISF